MKRVVFLAIASLLVIGLVLPGCSAAPTPEEHVIKIAVVGPMTDLQGQNQWDGATMAADEINFAGGVTINGTDYTVELVKVETKEATEGEDGSTGTTNLHAVINDVDFVVGGFRTQVVQIYREVAITAKKIFMNCGAATGSLQFSVVTDYDKYKYWFKATPYNETFLVKSLLKMTATIGTVLRQVLEEHGAAVFQGYRVPGDGKLRIAILMEDTAWCAGLVRAAQVYLPLLGYTVTGTTLVSPTASDITSELSAIVATRPHIIFTAFSGSVSHVYSIQKAALGIPAITIGINVPGQQLSHWTNTNGACEGEIMLDTWAVNLANTPTTLAWFDDYLSKFGRYPVYTADTYDAIKQVCHGIEATNSIDSDTLVAWLEDPVNAYMDGVASPKIGYYPMPAVETTPGELYALSEAQVSERYELASYGKTYDQNQWLCGFVSGVQQPHIAHDLVYGPGLVTGIGSQWQTVSGAGAKVGIWPMDLGDAYDAALTDQYGCWNFEYPGTMDVLIPIEGFLVTANLADEIRDWHDLDAVRNNLDGTYLLMNDLDSTTAGYEELASPTANGGKGWEPIGHLTVDPVHDYNVNPIDAFTGSLDGQGYEIRDLFINRPDEDGVGLFGCAGEGHVIENLGAVNAEVTGHVYVGSLVGENRQGTASNSYSAGSVTGDDYVGGLVGGNRWDRGYVRNSYSTASVTGINNVGGLAGGNWGTVINSYSTSTVTGRWTIGGLVGWNHMGTVTNSYSAGTVSGEGSVGGLVGGHRDGTVSNSYYDYDNVRINGKRIITIGALSNEDFDQWLANDKFLDVSERLSQEDGYYLINDVNDFKELLAFGQNPSLKFRLKKDLNLGDEPGFYIPYLAGQFDGNEHKIRNLSFHSDFVTQVGLFGYLASGGVVTGVSAENVNIFSNGIVGGLVGENDGTVSDSCSTGRVGGWWSVGALAGWIGWHGGTVSNSHYNYEDFLINDGHMITIGALSNQDFDLWLANDKSLDVNERLSQEDGYYLINDVSDFKQLLAFGQDDSLKFRLKNDLDLATQFNFYIPYLAGEFDGNGHKISNLRLRFNFAAQVGLFGYLASGGEVSRVGVENVNLAVNGAQEAGGLVGGSSGTVSNSYSSGVVGGRTNNVGGLVGWNEGTVSNSYSTGSVTGDWSVGGLVGCNYWNAWNPGTVSNSYSSGSVSSSQPEVGGLVGSAGGTTGNSFWDIETSGQSTSHGGVGKTTAEMQTIATFSGAGWNIVVVADPDMRNPSYIWNIVDGLTYPFLSWQPVF
jgi:branched-chain amino acid transport system substrate-binding protein